MKLLLDTHIWLWSLLEPAKLSRRVTRELQAAGDELWLSPISVWEALCLCEVPKLLDGPYARIERFDDESAILDLLPDFREP